MPLIVPLFSDCPDCTTGWWSTQRLHLVTLVSGGTWNTVLWHLLLRATPWSAVLLCPIMKPSPVRSMLGSCFWLMPYAIRVRTILSETCWMVPSVMKSDIMVFKVWYSRCVCVCVFPQRWQWSGCTSMLERKLGPMTCHSTMSKDKSVNTNYKRPNFEQKGWDAIMTKTEEY